MLLISFIIAAADQLIKFFIRTLPEGTVVFRIPYVAEITHYTNTGAAFSMLSGHVLFLMVISIVLLSAIVYLVLKLDLTFAGKMAFAALIGGGCGNMIDRVILGGVTDYIRLLFIRFPVFNLADIAITLSACFLSLLLLTNRLEVHPGEKHESDD